MRVDRPERAATVSTSTSSPTWALQSSSTREGSGDRRGWQNAREIVESRLAVGEPATDLHIDLRPGPSHQEHVVIVTMHSTSGGLMPRPFEPDEGPVDAGPYWCWF
jgi:hypothetical protein